MNETFEIRNVRCKGKVGGWGKKVFVGGRNLGFASVFFARFKMGHSVDSLAIRYAIQRETVENILRHLMNTQAPIAPEKER